jgi:DNA-binding MarR family transcriptional regulator
MVTDDLEQMGAELRRAVTRLYSRFRSERLEGEVPDAALLVLLVLDKQEQMSLSGLADTAHVSLGSMSQTVRRLEQQEYVRKTRDTEDRRRMMFSLTASGRAAATASRRHRRDWLNGRLAELTAAEQDHLRRAADLLLRLADS